MVVGLGERPTPGEVVELYQRFGEWQRHGEEEGEVRRALVEEAIEFYREVHAEMLAITDAARRGVSLTDCVLFTTTFPCHDCAKHIIASGIAEVVFFEPYAKSRVRDLHGDAVEVDDSGGQSQKVRFRTFVGVAPRMYPTVFRAVRRKQHVPFDERSAVLRLRDYDLSAMRLRIEHYDEDASVEREAVVIADLGIALNQASGSGGLHA